MPYYTTLSVYRLSELLFEKFSTPGLFLSKDAVLSCYGLGRTTGLVVDIGGSGVNITPVSDGWVEGKGVNRSPITTRMLDEYMLYLIQNKLTASNMPPIYPKYKINRSQNRSEYTPEGIRAALTPLLPTYEVLDFPNIGHNYDRFMNLELGRQLKEAVGRVAEGNLSDMYAKYNSIPASVYELPDGRVIDIGIERYQPYEVYFDPSLLPTDIFTRNLTTPGPAPTVLASFSSSSAQAIAKGLPRLVLDAVLGCEGDIQGNMLTGVVVTGGGAAVEGLPDRLRVEVCIHVYTSMYVPTLLLYA